jgi:hypothetical protein
MKPYKTKLLMANILLLVGGRGITTFLSFEYQLPEHIISEGVN